MAGSTPIWRALEEAGDSGLVANAFELPCFFKMRGEVGKRSGKIPQTGFQSAIGLPLDNLLDETRSIQCSSLEKRVPTMFRRLDFKLGSPDSRDHAKALEIRPAGRIEDLSQDVARGDGDGFFTPKGDRPHDCLFGPRVTGQFEPADLFNRQRNWHVNVSRMDGVRPAA